MSQEPAAEPAPPQPTEEHKRIAEGVGVWNVDCSFYMDPSQPPMEVKGKDTVEMLGPFWAQGLFECEMFGQPFRGRGSLGFDPKSSKYVSTWMDSMNPHLFHMTGQFDESGKILEMSGEGWDCMTDQMTTYRTTDEHVSKDHRVFEMFQALPDGNEIKMFTMVYKRA